jgi:hypothetical protein
VALAPGLEDTPERREAFYSRIIDDLERKLGENVRDAVEVKRIFALDDFRERYHAYKGTALGLSHTLFQTALWRPSHKSKRVENLYYNGTLLAHPYLPEKIGTNLIDTRDPFGMETIRALVETARSGGGYVVFIWPSPEEGNREELKIGYVLPVDDTWWVGSGVYLNEITGSATLISLSL